MKNEFTFLTYIYSKDNDKLMQFVWALPYKIEVKEILFAEKKWFVYFTLPDHIVPDKFPFKNFDLDGVI